MSLSVTILVSDLATPYLAYLTEQLTDRTELHARMAPALERFTRAYVHATSKGRHKTATRLGAKQSGHLTNAAIESGHDSEQAFITFPRISGLSRAFRDYHLTTPTEKGKKWIAIPAIASAYNRRPREFSDLKFIPFGGKYAGKLAALVKRSQSTRKFIVVFWLKSEVTIKQDRTLLPSDEGYRLEAEEVGKNYISDLDPTA